MDILKLIESYIGDPAQHTQAGLRYLTDQMWRYDGDDPAVYEAFFDAATAIKWEGRSIRESAARKLIQRMRVKAKLGSLPEIDQFIEVWMQRRGLSYRLDGHYHDPKDLSETGKPRDHNDNHVMAELMVWSQKYQFHNSQPHLRAALDLWCRDQRRKRAKQMLYTLAYKGDDHDAWIDFVTRISDPEQHTDEWLLAAITVFQTWIWRMKRKLAGDNPTIHVMPYLWHPTQGIGKSRLISEVFLAPVREAVHTVSSLSALNDNSFVSLFRSAFVIFLDDLEGSTKAEVGKLKSLMTGDRIVTRDLYEKASSGEVLSSLIATANWSISDVIRDETGMRRFFEIKAANPLPTNEMIKSFDAMRLWQSVDHTKPCPMFGAGVEAIVRRHQEQQRTQSLAEMWIDDDPYIQRGEWVRASDHFDVYRAWHERKFPAERTNLTKWGRQMAMLRGRGKVESRNTGRHVYHLISNTDAADAGFEKVVDIASVRRKLRTDRDAG